MIIELQNGVKELYQEKEDFDRILNIQGQTFRRHKNRRTLRIIRNGKGYFLKIHRRTGWREILKNLIRFRFPVVSAENELRAIRRLEGIGIETMRVAGFGKRGIPPAWLDSFLITEELENTVSLEDLSRNWPAAPPDFTIKTTIIKSIAEITRCMHQNGVNHRDFYICHFLVDSNSLKKLSDKGLRIYLIDLHRVQLRKHTPRRWKIKDLAGLFFSSMDIGLTRRDVFRFMTIYSGKPLRQLLTEEADFWSSVQRRARRIYLKDFQRLPAFRI